MEKCYAADNESIVIAHMNSKTVLKLRIFVCRTDYYKNNNLVVCNHFQSVANNGYIIMKYR